jgi:chromosome condensin MukBEF complex kleisin-like MukF subunit
MEFEEIFLRELEAHGKSPEDVEFDFVAELKECA